MISNDGRSSAAYSLLRGNFMTITIIVFLIVLLDQISKYFANVYLNGNDAYQFIPNLLSFQYHENKGAAWGMLADHRWVFMLISTLAIIGIIVFLILTKQEKQSFLFRLSLSFFVGGGIGNMIDRIFLGYVIDFLKFEFIDFPIFNVADSFITCGAFLMILTLIIDTISESKTKKHE